MITYRPHAIVLDEICNWAELPHLPAGGGRVPTANVKDFIRKIHGTNRDKYPDNVGPCSTDPVHCTDEVPDTAKMEAWLYASEHGVMMLGLEAWAFGQDVDGVSHLDSGSSPDEVGLQLSIPCPGPSFTDVELSFLHDDLLAGEDGSYPSSDPLEDLRLHVYVEDGSNDWVEVGQDDNDYYDGDSYGGFRFDGGDFESIELIKADIDPSSCGPSPYPALEVKIVAECHATDGTCDDTFDEQNFAYVADVQVAWTTGSGTTIDYVSLAPLDATPLKSDPDFLSTSNDPWRYFGLTYTNAELDEIDSVIVRYTNGWPDQSVRSDAQARLMDAVGYTVEPEDLSLAYIESNYWTADYPISYLQETLENTEAYTDGMIAGGFSMAYWDVRYNGVDDGTGAGEHAERFEFDDPIDFNYTTPDATDDFTHFLFSPSDRQTDAWPGWYQQYTTYFDLDFVDPDAELSFEIANWGCSGCLPEEEEDPKEIDTVIDFYYEEYDGPVYDPTLVDYGHRYYLMRDSGYAALVYNDSFLPNLTNWVKTSGRYKVVVTMYTIAKPEGVRHGFFRMVDVSGVPSPNYPTVDVGEWDFRTGVWTSDDLDDDYIELPWGLDGYWTLGTSGYTSDELDQITYDQDELSHTALPYAALQARDLMDCLYTFWEDDPNWDESCELAGEWE